MTDPFADDEAAYTVVANEQRHCSLWPAHLAIPAGWSVVHGPTSRQACLDYVATQHSDTPPAERLDQAGPSAEEASSRP